MAVSATDTPTKVLVTEDGAIGENGANGANGTGFSLVRAFLLSNPVLRILKRNEVARVLTGNIDYSRNSTATYFDIYGDFQSVSNDILRQSANGYRFDGESTNLLLNSESPVTQVVNLAADDYVLSMTGTGSVDTVDGSATEGSPLLFNNSGNINFQVSGTVDTFQVEQGVCETSFIITDGTAKTRSKDVMTLDLAGNIPNLTTDFSVLFGLNTICNDFCVIDSTPLRVEINSSGFIEVNGVASIASYSNVNLVSVIGVNTLIYVDGVLADTISVTYSNVPTGSVRVAARTDDSKPLIGDLLDLNIYDFGLNADEALFLKG
tara:strand:+ start:2097 stop:3059 length:963 start_codon:yes stop_codon:yes gene_type:complete